MNFGRATHFTDKETSQTRTRKLNDLVSSVYRIFQELVPSSSSSASKSVFGHTSEMPDKFGLNKDHDKRYMTRAELNAWLVTALGGFGVIRITNSDSPYTVETGINAPHNIFCDTDGGAITVNLPAIVNEQYKIMNTGTSANNVTLTPNGTDLLLGFNANQTIADQASLMLNGETTEGWA